MMGEEDDDWGLSAEQLDFLEEDAIRKISQRKSASASASASVPDNSDRYRNAEAFSPTQLSQPNVLRETEKNWTNDLPKLSVSLFLHHSGMVAAKFPYSPMLVDAFHKIPKATWNGRERVWIFPPSSLEKAEEVLSAVPGAAVEVHKLDPLVRRALVAASAVPDLQDLYDRMPSYIESRLLPFQREGVRFVLQHGGRVLVADEMGLGKTLQAIAVAACFPDAWPVLVITPSSLRLHWASMVQEWLNLPSTDILVVLSQSGGSNKAGFKVVYSNSKPKIHLDGVFNIISYDVIPKIQDILLNSEFKIVVADESHFLKNPQAKRTNASLPVLQKARYVILLSGTPALSRPIELFKQLEALYPDVYKNVHEYGNRYCRGGVFGCYQGASNHEELHNLMRATVMIRRLKKDVISQLPVKRRQQVFLDLNEKDMKQIRALFRELEAVKSSIQSCDSKEKISSLKIVEKNLINKIYTDSAEAKIPAVLDYLATVIEAGCKFLIFAHHQPMIDAIHQFLLKKKVDCIRIDGSTPTTSRQTLVTDFQEKDAIKAAVLSIKAGGVGLTLTAASTVIFAELSWTPGDIIQAEDRVHRIGQESAVNIYYLLANDTIDDIIWDAVLSKLENLGQVLDGQEKTLEVDVSGAGKSPIAKKGMVETSRSPVGKKGMAGTSTSPGKQTTLDSFLKRCHSPTDSQLRAKTPRF
ncbi:SWI/SNF-related matrix-associated actin-dependent regulator of chromatin subfamily A-like protein 1 isoform X1 [Ananas comosus]|uniref:SWI/SNF-related matrix-associated actin-dependent regulator of chromatin subfamily A-like protein 1 isoform X1 n=2 Tax=Ananas comosus TaxID=4615 RepID=A0A6P5F174_ANACO|nr:SWI/SNF-related matrix-associated actin-dependent regulator of chromatin subfamily A-like protein 1 isoform X1 [Ananas comosus]